jgi:glucokinase
MSNSHWIGVDLGGTKILAGLFSDDFRLLARVKQATNAERGAEAVFESIAVAVEQVIRDSGVHRDRIKGLGLGIPGQVDPRVGRVRYAPNLNWREVDLAKSLPPNWPWPVVAENDVRMGTFGEFTHGAARGARHVLGVFVGTGVGGGIIIDGELYTGFNFNAGEIGHVIVHWRRGTELEAIAGRRSQMRRAKEILEDAPRRVRKEWRGIDPDKVKSSQLADLYMRDDPIAVQLVDDSARALGAAIGSAINFLNPEVVVLGGGVSGALGESFSERIWEIAQRYTLPAAAEGVRFVMAELKDDSGIYGAAEYAKRSVNASTKRRR